MSLFRHTATLLEVADATAVAQTGTSYVVLPSDGDGVRDDEQVFRVFFDATQDGGVTAPTVDVHLQTSHDHEEWVTVASATQLAANGAVHEFEAIAALGPHVRAVTQLGGATLPNHTAKVVLASNAPFRLKAVS